MQPKSTIPNSVLDAGLPARFRYWSGRSGGRYLFTHTDLAGLDHFDEAVVILVRFGRIIWAGMPPDSEEKAAEMLGLARREGTEIYIHLLARTQDQREGIVEDLRAVVHVEQIDPCGPARILEFPVAA